MRKTIVPTIYDSLPVFAAAAGGARRREEDTPTESLPVEDKKTSDAANSERVVMQPSIPPKKNRGPTFEIIRGKPEDIPESLLGNRSSYNWNDLGIGDRIRVPHADATAARASAYAFAKANKRKFKSEQTADKKFVDIWRVMDPNEGDEEDDE